MLRSDLVQFSGSHRFVPFPWTVVSSLLVFIDFAGCCPSSSVCSPPLPLRELVYIGSCPICSNCFFSTPRLDMSFLLWSDPVFFLIALLQFFILSGNPFKPHRFINLSPMVRGSSPLRFHFLQSDPSPYGNMLHISSTSMLQSGMSTNDLDERIMPLVHEWSVYTTVRSRLSPIQS